MVLAIAESISSFSPVSPADQLITLTYGQLQDIIKHAVAEAVAPLEARISALEASTASQGDHLADLERQQDYASEQDLIQLRLIKDLREEIKPEEPSTTAKPSPHIDELYNNMKLVGLKQTTFAGASKILKLTKQRVLQLKPAIAQDMRFIILPSQSHSQKLVIRLREC